VIDNRLTGTKNTTYSFDLAGNLKTLKYPNAVTNLWEYDTRNRLTNEVWKLNTTMLGSFSYQLGAAGNRISLSDSVNGASRTYAWSYDSLYRLTNETISITAPTGSIGYQYDRVSNRTNRASTISGIGNQALSYTSNDWLTIDSYDNNGNTVNSASIAYQYDWANRLTNANNGAVPIIYDADGNRIKKVAGGVTTLYLVDRENLTGYAQVVEESTVSGSTTNLSVAYAYGLDLIAQRRSDGTVHFYGYDGLGSTRFLLNTNGGVVDAYVYDGYGSLIASNGIPLTVYLFAGEQLDPHLNQYYNRARVWNPNTGRFSSKDSFEGNRFDPISLHKYLYASDDPINRVDPSGNETLSSVFYGISARITVFAQTFGPAIYGLRVALATVTLAAIIADPEIRGAYVSALGGPGNAMTLVAADIRLAASAANGLARYGTLKPNIITIRYNRGNAADFRIKTAELKRTAQEGGLTVVSNPSRIRDVSAQAAYRRAVFVRYVRYLQQAGMTEEQATAHATAKFRDLHADHRIDLQVSGALKDANDTSNLGMRDGSVNTSVGKQIALEIERLNLETGDQIHDVNIIGPE
jgi:RHS repeat-associated protein